MARLGEKEREYIEQAKRVHDAEAGALGRPLRERVVAAYRAYRRRQRTIAALNALDDTILADIGVQRGNIRALATELARQRERAGAAPRRQGSLAAAYRRWRARRASIRELRRLDDRTLADIGIARNRIDTVVDGLLAGDRAATRAPLGDVLRQADEALVRPLRKWDMTRRAAGQMARMDRETLADLGYVKGDLDWVPGVLAGRRLPRRAANRNAASERDIA